MFMAKSCTIEEFETLTKNAKSYADYFESAKGSNSFISKVSQELVSLHVSQMHFVIGVWSLSDETQFTDRLLLCYEQYILFQGRA
jgi:hypothetical protein